MKKKTSINEENLIKDIMPERPLKPDKEEEKLHIHYLKIADIEKANEGIITDSSRRKLDEDNVQIIANSIEESTLFNPILVTPDYKIIAGMHRLAAMILLEKKEIPCIIIKEDKDITELIRIDENLIRGDLHYVDKAKQLKRRKEIYEDLYPETKKDMFKGNKYTGSLVGDVFSFTKNAAKKINVSRRTIERYIYLAERLTPEIEDVLREECISRQEAFLLVDLDEQVQKEIMEKLRNGDIRRPSDFIKEKPRKKKLQIDRKVYNKLAQIAKNKKTTINRLLEYFIAGINT